MKKFVALLLAVAMTMGMVACGGAQESAPAATEPNAPVASGEATGNAGEKTTYKVGILNYVDDASLNQIVANIKAELEEYGAANNVEFVIKEDNCMADANTMNQAIADFIADEVDLMVGVATPVAMAMQAATEDNQIPVVFAAVSDPIATQIVASMDAPGANITGTSDALDTTAIMNLILAQNPGIETVGLLYDAGQDSSTTAIAEAKAFLEEKNITVVEKTGTNNDEIALAAQALVDAGCTAIFTPSDNTVMTAELSIYKEILAENGVQHYAGADSFALNGAFVGYGVDYANLGRETGKMVCDILVNGKDPATYAVKTFDNGTATVNTDTCELLNLNYADVEAAFAPYCTKVQSIVTAESFDDLQ